MSDYYIGLMSGTSMDAVDACLVNFADASIQLVATHAEPITEELKQSLLALCQPGDNEIDRLGVLDVQLGEYFAVAVEKLLANASVSRQKVRAIGSHGQTIRHRPQGSYPFTLQIGDPNVIASKTGITTVADFRRRDMAVGGQGAPLVPAFHRAFFHNAAHSRVVVNIGGIANITVLPAQSSQSVVGFDTGPGNTLMDMWSFQQRGLHYDKDGAWATQGCVDKELLSTLLADDYFALRPPKSTGREYFNHGWLTNHMSVELAPENVQATLLELTATSIANAIADDIHDVIVCGGGAYNNALMQRLTALCNKQPVVSSASLGLAPEWVEGCAFAWLAQQTLAGQPANIPAVTGARKAVVLGGVYAG